jgi:heparin binding hemagglutinin HbhA
MAITDDLRKTLTDPTPLYFAAGTADLAVQQAKKVPALIEQLKAEAPSRIDAVRNTDPKAVQEKVTIQAKEAQATVQAKVTEVLETFDTDLKKLGESAQDLALRSVGVAAEYAVKAREAYEKVAEHGEQTVRAWRGEAADEIAEIAVAVEPATEVKAEPKAEAKTEAKAEPKAEAKKPAPPAARKAPPSRKPAAKKATPPAK